MLAGIVITKNEEKNILRCIRSLSFCDEVIVVDSESTDKTVEIAKANGAKVHVRSWTGYSEQKNFANSLTQCDWILSLDADEEVSIQLRAEILNLLKSAPIQSSFTIPRKTIHSGKWIRWGGWYPNRLSRLFKKSAGQWEGDDVHEAWVTKGTVGELKEDLIHYSFDNIFDQVTRNNRYSTLGALALKRKGRRFSVPLLLFKPFSKFVETYLLKLGFLDGYLGFVICVSAAYSVFLKWAKLRELELENS